MPRPLTVATLATFLIAALACGGGDNKVPKPWVKREGQREVIGNPTHVDDVHPSAADAEELPADRPPSDPLPVQQIERTEPQVQQDLPPVLDNYDSLEQAGEITACPEGTTLLDERRTRGAEYCVLENGVRHGPFMLWYPNGQLKEVGPYVGGKREGTVTSWDRRGKKYSTYQWKDGNPVSGEVYK